MIWENRDPFKKNKREALIKKMVLKRLGDEIRLSLCPAEESVCQSFCLIQFSNRPHYMPMFGRVISTSVFVFLSSPIFYFLIVFSHYIRKLPVRFGWKKRILRLVKKRGFRLLWFLLLWVYLVVNTGNPGFPEPWLSEIRRRTWQNPGIFFDFSSCFLGFSGRGFWKILRAGLRIFLDRFRASWTKFRPISFHFSVVSAFWSQGVWKSNCFFYS